MKANLRKCLIQERNQLLATIDVPGLGRKSMYDQDDLLQSVFVAEEGLVEPESVLLLIINLFKKKGAVLKS